MSAPETSTPQSNRRSLLIAIAAVVVLVLAGGGYYGFRAYSAGQPGNINTPSPLGDIALGPADARVTIVEYASMTCPHCAAFTKETFPKLKATYIDTGKVRYVFREFPLDQLALLGAQLARCIAKGDPPKFFNAIDVLFASQEKWAASRTNPVPILQQIGKQAGMTEKAFDECLKDQTLYNNIMAVRERGSKEYKVESTPTLFVNGKLQKGGATIEDLDKLIVPLLPKS